VPTGRARDIAISFARPRKPKQSLKVRHKSTVNARSSTDDERSTVTTRQHTVTRSCSIAVHYLFFRRTNKYPSLESWRDPSGAGAVTSSVPNNAVCVSDSSSEASGRPLRTRIGFCECCFRT
jgi:hypothetical protein